MAEMNVTVSTETSTYLLQPGDISINEIVVRGGDLHPW